MLLQQGQRFSLLPEAMTIEDPLWETLVQTSITGFQADVIVSTLGVLFAALCSFLTLGARRLFLWSLPPLQLSIVLPKIFRLWTWVIGAGFMLVLTIDMGYYHHAHSHLDFVFFEYIEDLLFPREGINPIADDSSAPNQALQQTEAELNQFSKWSKAVGIFLGIELVLGVGWWWCFHRLLAPQVFHWKESSPKLIQGVLTACIMGGLMGFNVYGPWGVQRANITSSTYYMLAQNPIWHGWEVWVGTLLYQITGAKADLLKTMDFEEALQVSRQILGPQAHYPSPEYPLVRTFPEPHPHPSKTNPINILLIFLEGLDRRYLGQTMDLNHLQEKNLTFFYGSRPYQYEEMENRPSSQIPITPFLDRLRKDSIFFEHFFSNGDMTARALFSTFCSYFPRRGWAIMKTRYTHEFLCLPEILQEAGYWTEMVVGQNRDRNYDHIGLFLAKHGIRQFLDENNFPPHAQRIGLGLTDESLFQFVQDRVEDLRETGQPYFLSTLTVGTHHPYHYPLNHPDLKALQPSHDQYVPALRYLDLSLEKFFATMQEQHLFDNTIVFIMGDHGRHEGIGGSSAAARGSHFLVPLYIWIDPSLHSAFPTRRRMISDIASHVDIAPTILSMLNLTPRLSPFLGRDLTCAMTSDCLADNVAYLSGAHDDVVGLATHDFIWLYRFKTKRFFRTSLDGYHPENDLHIEENSIEWTDPTSPLITIRRQLFGLYVTTNLLLEEGKIWSKQKFGHEVLARNR